MTFNPFAAPILKIERAKHHINDLSGQINSYLGQRPFRLMLTQYPDLSELQLSVHTNKPIPEALSFVIGDAIHNLRSALDIMIYGLIGHKVSNPETILFPISKTKQGFQSTVYGRQIQLAGPKVIPAIEALEPYPDGKYGLYALHELDIRDKHRLILPAWRTAEITQADFKKIHELFDFKRADDTTLNFQMDPDKPVLAAVQFQHGGPARDIPFHQEEASVQPLFRLCFDKGHDLASWPLVEGLLFLTKSCELTVSTVRDAI
jgi:hypothetical protein